MFMNFRQKIYGNGKYLKNTLIKMKSYPLIFLLFVIKIIKLERRYELIDLTEAADVAQWSHTGNATHQLLA